MPEPEQIAVDTIRAILERRSELATEIGPTSDFFNDLELDSLEVAELSAVLEETFGRDPWTAGETPRSVREITEYYVRTRV